jgi:hypothetical protein
MTTAFPNSLGIAAIYLMAEGQTFPAEHFRDQIVSELEDDRLL